MKNKLAELIESYAAARAVGNKRLFEYATTELRQFLDSIEIAQAKTVNVATAEESHVWPHPQ